ncbi:hypothetical protein J3Q64DRAFT_1679662 [Phycomyces blakesleeanus]|uniref:F-box domain-containing protein n=2 Tax=Phycomyces blakesleeanus TaxID=4837 RepID=A0A163AJ57_PHYB8|nr:hypothetical protein PHYBLDRAFT_181389 [Phycomyces blakesleeanus NRRL 1555(-)]OAD73851.1 hypothetical protein PHYBLDRAFT_181389 [Phycomyces blakesleeanus NRRL 1555(-)]|eukprot:XP_018291891.1 hypothetical protein PHYBLDRAFT_181389 [Phycomyces blakesleeanus NRRL 1555(-)]
MQSIPTHLALCLPEIVSHVISFLDDHQSETTSKYAGRLASMSVNRLWHDCTMRAVWRKVEFDDTKEEVMALQKFASVFSNEYTEQDIFDSSDPTTHDKTKDRPRETAQINQIINTSHVIHIDDHVLNDLSPISHVPMYRTTLQSLSLRKIKYKTIDVPLEKIARHATQLSHLDVYICDYFTNTALSAFLCHRRLTYLSLAGCYRITDEAILKVAETCPLLEHLDMRACGLISDVSVSAIALSCPGLRHLNVGRIRERHRITHKSISLIARHTRAVVLGLAGCDIDDDCMLLLAQLRGSLLERVSVNNCPRLTNATLHAYVQYCPSLSVFEMKECHQVDDWEAVAKLVQRKVLLTLCDQQNMACTAWARRRGHALEVKAPMK